MWVGVGGRGSLHGAILGAILVNYAKTYFTGALPEAWLYVLGGLFIVVTLFLPKGLVGSIPAFATKDFSLFGHKFGSAKTEARP